jgi:hypothetical protein
MAKFLLQPSEICRSHEETTASQKNRFVRARMNIVRVRKSEHHPTQICEDKNEYCEDKERKQSTKQIREDKGG